MVAWPFITIPLIAWLSAQLLKFAFVAYKGDVDFGKLYRSGGMPSGHTALIVSITATLGFTEGAQSPLFGFAVCISAIIIYDALGVRRSTGLQAAAIRQLTATQSPKTKIELELGSAKGHTPSEVFAGGSLGLIIALLLTYERSLARLDILLNSPPSELYLLTTLPVIVAVTTVVAARNYKSVSLRRTKAFLTSSMLLSLVVFFSIINGVPFFGTWLALLILTSGLPIAGWWLSKWVPAKSTLKKPLPPKRKQRRSKHKTKKR